VCFYDGILTKFACLAGRLNGSGLQPKKAERTPQRRHLMPGVVMQWSMARSDGFLCHRGYRNGQLIRGNQVQLAGHCLGQLRWS